MLLMDGNFNPFAMLNKQEREETRTHYLYQGECVIVRYVFLSHK